MGRTKNRFKVPMSSTERVRMHRQRKKLMQEKEKRIEEYLTSWQANVPRIEELSAKSNDESLSLRDLLGNWVNIYNISLRAVDSLLSILIESGITVVPKNHRTLLRTPTNNRMEDVAGGKLWYNGLAKNLRRCLMISPYV